MNPLPWLNMKAKPMAKKRTPQRQVSTMHSIKTLTVSRERQKPASSMVKPTCIPKTRNAATREAGFCRSRETVNVLMECIVDTCLCGVLFFAFGFAFMFSHGNGLIGYHWFFLKDVPATYEATGVAFLAFWLFQFAFADTCSTITSGAMIGRTGFVGDLVYSVGVSGFIYPIIGHWAWSPDC